MALTIVLDRDGTIVSDRHYLSDPEQLEFLPGSVAGLRALADAGHRLIVVTNQSGLGRGYFTSLQWAQVQLRFDAMLAAEGILMARTYVCPHAPAAGCSCRKPAQALMHQAMHDFAFAARDAVVIGDKDSDVEFGRMAGACTIRIGTEAAARAAKADAAAADLFEASEIIKTRLANEIWNRGT